VDVKDWGGGLTQHEIEAIEKMKSVFSDSHQTKKTESTL